MANWTKTLTFYFSRCERCGHEWKRRREDMPKVCPRCKSFKWNEPRKTEEERMLRLTRQEWDELVDATMGIKDCPDWILDLAIGFPDNGFSNLEPIPKSRHPMRWLNAALNEGNGTYNP